MPALAAKLRPFLLGAISEVASNVMAALHIGEGPGIAITGESPQQVVGLGGDSILLYHADGRPVAEFAPTDTGLTAALAAMAAGDGAVELPICTISGGPWTVANGTLRGMSREGSVLSGLVILSDGSALENLTIDRDEDDAGAIYGVIGPSSGSARLLDCTIRVINATGNGYAIQAGNGAISLLFCEIHAESGGVESSPFGISGSTTHTVVSSTSTPCLSLWNGATNDEPPADWETTEFDDSGWGDAVLATLGIHGPPVSGSYAIWHTDRGVSTPAGEHCLFRDTVAIPAGPTVSATLTVKCDDAGDYYVNGALVASDVSNAVVDVAAHITAGQDNVVAVRGKDIPGGTVWQSYKLEVEIAGGALANVYIHACQFNEGLTAPVMLSGDRSAYNVTEYANLHASDIADAALLRHLPTPGAAGNYTRSNGTNWVSQLGLLLADLADYARGAIIRGGATAWEVLTIGVAGKVLKSDGTDVSWGDVDHSELTGVGTDDHHARYTDGEADARIAAASIDDLADVNVGTPDDEDVLTWDEAEGEWVASPPVAGAAALADLTDVNAPAPDDGDVLMWDDTAGEWIAAPGGVSAFTDLTDAPSSYSGQAGKVPAVNAGESALEFVNLPELPETSYAETIGDGVDTSFDVVHDLDSTDVIVQVWDLDAVPVTLFEPDSVLVIDADTVRVAFAAAPDTDQMRVVIVIGGGGLTEMDVLQVQVFA